MCNEYEKSWVEFYRAQDKLRLMYSWREFFKKNLKFKRPFIANGHFYYEKPSHDGTVPQELREDDWFQGAKIFEESSEDVDSEEERRKAEEEERKKNEVPKKKKILTLEDKERIR